MFLSVGNSRGLVCEMRFSRELAVWALLCCALGGVVVVYLSLVLEMNGEALIMPIDDTYIHFQYARQMATGHPFTYNTGEPPTSGATSLIYTPLLAIGYLLGFTGLSLSYWAIFLGVLSFLLSSWLIYQSVREAGGSQLLSTLTMLTLALNGAFIWAALSGMEATLFVFAVLLCLYAYQKEWQQKAVLAGILVALIRPEGALVAVLLAAALIWRHWKSRHRFFAWAILPVIAASLQPVLNLWLTGSFSASGNQAKSHFHDVTSPMIDHLQKTLEFWVRMWREFIEGRARFGDPYVPGVITLLAMIMIGLGVRYSLKKREIHPALLAGLWAVLMSAAVATLETAFWHYKRYQLPIMALFVPLTGWLLVLLARHFKHEWPFTALAGIALLLSIQTNATFIELYQNNVSVTANLQFSMANWINTNLPANARVGVFDVGAVAYIGGHPIYDVVGLTTPGVARASRQGPGAVYDTMASHPQRPDFFALYPDVHVETVYLMRTRVWGQTLAQFEAPPVPNAAAAGKYQLVAEANWEGLDKANRIQQPSSLAYLEGFREIESINVGDINSEKASQYDWHNQAKVQGYLTSLDELPYFACQAQPCVVVDGTRSINGGESFSLPGIEMDEDYLIVMRVHAREPAELAFGCGEKRGIRVVPAIPGYWVELAFLVPGSADNFCIEAQEGTYHAARYWVYAGHYDYQAPDVTPLADWGGISLLEYEIEQNTDALTVDLTWFANGDNLPRDGKLFVHLYDDPYQAPVAQWDGYLRKTLPLANLLPGIWDEQIQVSLTNVPAGDYTIGIGFYDKYSGQRFPVQARHTDPEGQRVMLRTITIP